jgi:hypothetical protein
MNSKKFHQFFDWANSGAAAASLVFFGLLFSSGSGESLEGALSMALFFFAMFALVAASAVGKMVDDLEVVPDKVDQIHTLATATGITAFTLGLTLLAMSVSRWMAVPLLFGLSALAISFKRAHDDLLS